MKKNLSRYSTNLAISLLERIIKARFQVSGLDNLQPGPTLFVINHFTRAETFLIPHVILKYGGDFVRTLADDALFVGRFGEYLERLGVMSTNEPHRDRHIIGDLMTGRQNWAIYPEGEMVKTKRLIRQGRFRFARPSLMVAPKTGAAAIALKAEIYKKRYRRALARGDAARVEDLQKKFFIDSPEDLSDRETVIIPVTLTYYPLRPGDNAIKSTVERFAKKIPPRLAEELEVEGNLLLSDSDIHIHFGDPIRMTGFLTRHFFFSRWIPRRFRSLERNNLLLRHEARRLTRRFMQKISSSLTINIDHLFCSAFRHMNRNKMNAVDFHRAIYLTASDLMRDAEFRLHRTLEKDLVELLAGIPHSPAESILSLAEDRGILKRQNGEYRINKLQFEMMHMFHTIRLKNPLVVIANELEPLKLVVRILSGYMNTQPSKLCEETAERIVHDDLDRYSARYRSSFEEGVSPDKGMGAPFFRRAKGSRVGIVLSHGFLSAPEEIRPLARLLHEKGYSVYGVRLEGHGTTPTDLAETGWRDWYQSYLRGYEVLRCCCDRVFLGGFSTGGVVALLAAGMWPDVDGVISISSPHDLGDIRARLLPAVNFWNELLNKLSIEKGKLDFVENNPENPDINYNQIPVKGLRQLEELMEKCRKGLPDILSPVLLMHGRNDPGVSVKSMSKYSDRIGSPEKELVLLDSDHHVVVRREIRHQIADNIDQFIQKTIAPAHDILH